MQWDSLHDCRAVMDDGSSGRKKEKTELGAVLSAKK